MYKSQCPNQNRSPPVLHGRIPVYVTENFDLQTPQIILIARNGACTYDLQ